MRTFKTLKKGVKLTAFLLYSFLFLKDDLSSEFRVGHNKIFVSYQIFVSDLSLERNCKEEKTFAHFNPCMVFPPPPPISIKMKPPDNSLYVL